ncbi:MAG: MFS transporter [SAR324 cluster bacterium]|nr:MFS transporter [SAR324 cluster bacterium]
MLGVLQHPAYRRLFAAQAVSLLGTGLASVALGLLVFELGGANAGVILGTVLAIKIIAYVTIAPVAEALLGNLPRRTVLVLLDLVRAGFVLVLPWVTEIWQIYLLIFLLQAASAGFTPLFQATIPDLLKNEEDYTKALSLSRLAYDLETLLSPVLASLLLAVVTWQGLYAGTFCGFLASAALVCTVSLPFSKKTQLPFLKRVTRGMQIYLATPRLQGGLILHGVVAAAGAMVFVNTVVLVQGHFGLNEQDTALTLTVFGIGSMLVALVSPKLLERYSERNVMLLGSLMLVISLGMATSIEKWSELLPIWMIMGFGYSMIHVPMGRLLTRSAHTKDRPALFAAHFSLSHACWLIAYPTVGWLCENLELSLTFGILALGCLLGCLLAWRAWPKIDPMDLEHRHDDLSSNHPHLSGKKVHVHPYVIDDLHPQWPGR